MLNIDKRFEIWLNAYNITLESITKVVSINADEGVLSEDECANIDAICANIADNSLLAAVDAFKEIEEGKK